jgi:hypothetical protein
MKRLICSAAVASALLAVTAIPSGAGTIDLLGMSSVAGTAYDTTYSFNLPTTETVMVAGAEFNIAPFTITGLPFSVTSTPPPSFGNPSLFDASGSLGPGNYSLTVMGTGGTALIPISLYAGFITTSGSVSPVPIPGTLVLFLSGLGLLGFWGWTKGRKGGLGSASLEAAAC